MKEDTKSTRSMLAIKDALVSCLGQKAFRDISVSELSREANVSRVTFYRFFSNTTDVLEFLCDSIFFDAARDFTSVQRDESEEYFIYLFRYILQRSELLDAVFKSHRIDIFQRSFDRYVDRYVPKIRNRFNSREAEYIKVSISAVFASIVFVWEKHGKIETPEELFHIFRRAVIDI